MKYRGVIALTIVLAALGAVAGFVYANYIKTTMYTSDARIMVVDPATTSRAQNYAELVKTRSVVESAMEQSKSPYSYEQILASLAATNKAGTDMVKISVATDNPEQSKKLLDAIVASVAREGSRLYGKNSVKTVDAASAPTNTSEGATLKMTLMAALAGMSLALAIAFIRADFVQDDVPRGRAARTDEDADNRKVTSRKAFGSLSL